MKTIPFHAFLLTLSLIGLVRADVKLPAIFGDHMVLQQDGKIPVWGFAEPGERVIVSLGRCQEQTIADATGKWRVDLPPSPTTATPASLTVTGKNSITFSDVLVGDVWFASGQSNMEYELHKAHTAAADIPKAGDPQLRFFTIPRTNRLEPQTDLPGKWEICTPQTAGRFTAVGYYFARELRPLIQRPIGIIASYWGGTPIKSWISLSGLEKSPAFTGQIQEFQRQQDIFLKNKDAWPQLQADYEAARKTWNEAAATAKAAGQPAPAAPRPPANPLGPPSTPTCLFNGMVAPVLPYGIKGVIWYQGETDACSPGGGPFYAFLFPRLITDWREKWGRGDFPFLYVQIANFIWDKESPQGESWAWLRESQRLTLSLPQTGMASAIDLGHPYDIHPKDKLDVGLRLAQVAQAVAYGRKVVPGGPLYTTHQIEGGKVRVSFKDVGGGLKIGVAPWSPDGSPLTPSATLTGFTIAGTDRKFVPAQARIDGSTVLVWSDEVPAPAAVRHGWMNNPVVSLYNQENFPASPFRTDDWPQTTEPQRSRLAPAVEWMKQCEQRVAAIQGKPCDLIFIGDSITQNFQEEPRNGWNLVGRAVWDQYYSGRNVLNFGVGSDSIQNALWRLENMDLKSLHPKVAVIMLGLNNPDHTPGDIASGVQAVIDKTRALFPGVKVIVMSVTANGRMPVKTPLINDLLKALADGQNIFYVDLYSQMPAVGDGWTGVGGDKVHLTPAGYEIWAATLEPTLKKLLDE